MSSLHVVLMGVSGSGKTTLARKMAERTGWELLEADDLHPEADMEILQGGKLPSEEKRIDWLGSVRDWMTERAAESKNTIVACTALRKEHREVLNQAEGVVFYVHPYGTEDVLADRMRRRVGEDMPRELLDEQLAILRRLEADERGIQLDIDRPVDELLEDALAAAKFAHRAYS
ncbi:gluconokinase [Corynebacterium resistens DSM 45100]|uniref:Gluconokinase n=1 Tax=Corynebacterium resistens (strain DSM 45100 / JCM 12819 / GTC 2026 / SICGH 158) TaxID=662755 RepID=F8E120_CORRG|nr:gluconokinase, GntK/IdnK-type [Corynebacterium resistens]AEI08469.1 gluconokinase [Corynebacterium resistens DSM 45100]